MQAKTKTKAPKAECQSCPSASCGAGSHLRLAPLHACSFRSSLLHTRPKASKVKQKESLLLGFFDQAPASRGLYGFPRSTVVKILDQGGAQPAQPYASHCTVSSIFLSLTTLGFQPLPQHHHHRVLHVAAAPTTSPHPTATCNQALLNPIRICMEGPGGPSVTLLSFIKVRKYVCTPNEASHLLQ